MVYSMVGKEVELIQYFLRVHSAAQYHKTLRLTERELTLLSYLLWEEDPFSARSRTYISKQMKISTANYSTVLKILTDKNYLTKNNGDYIFPQFLRELREQLYNGDKVSVSIDFMVGHLPSKINDVSEE